MAVAAHGVASGHLPDTTGLILLALLGIAAGAISRRLTSAAGFVALLSATQIAAHTSLTVSAEPMAMAHPTSPRVMLITHLIAVPLCALLIAGAGHLYQVITSVLAAVRVLIGTPITDRNRTRTHRTSAPEPLIALVAPGGTGVRGPPAS